jgi:tetratricopeptide (TPR) repeat protein
MRFTQVAVSISLCGCVACAAHTLPVAAPADVGPTLQVRLDAADALVRVGCLDCLLEAFDAYEAIGATPMTPVSLTTRSAIGAVRTALLIDLRERELGTSDDGYLRRARDLLATHTDLEQTFQTPVAVLDTIPWRSLRIGGASVDPAGMQRLRRAQANQTAWLGSLQATADDDPFAASLWVAFSCGQRPPAERQPAMLMAALPNQHESPGVRYELAICGVIDDAALTELQQLEPRFTEDHFWLGLRALSQQHLDEAQARLAAALDWHPRWPSAALALAGVDMAAEDLNGALRLYDVTLTLLPDSPEAALGRVRALSYLGRYLDALAGVDDLARLQWFPGEASYWRAWNELQLGRLEEAWTDVQHAEHLSVSADVSKLAGMIAERRNELIVARGRFETARGLNPADCEISVYLGGVEADLRDWAPSVEVFIAAAACLQDEKSNLAQQIAAIEASGGSPERVARQTASRRQELANANRLLAQSWFNMAADAFNLSRKADARTYAEKVVDDPQFGPRARDLIARLDR